MNSDRPRARLVFRPDSRLAPPPRGAGFHAVLGCHARAWHRGDDPSDPSALVDPLRRLVNQLDPELPVVFAEPASQLAAARNIVLRVGAAAGGLLGWLTFVLAMGGLYGVLSALSAFSA